MYAEINNINYDNPYRLISYNLRLVITNPYIRIHRFYGLTQSI